MKKTKSKIIVLFCCGVATVAVVAILESPAVKQFMADYKFIAYCEEKMEKANLGLRTNSNKELAIALAEKVLDECYVHMQELAEKYD